MSEEQGKDTKAAADTEQIQIPNYFELWKELYFNTEKDWSNTIRDFITTDTFVSFIDKTLEQYLALTKVNRQHLDKLAEYSLQPTKKDIARVAELVISMEDKIDNIEFELFDEINKFTSTLIRMIDLQESLQTNYEERLSTMVEQMGKMAKKIEQMDRKLNEIKRKNNETKTITTSEEN